MGRFLMITGFLIVFLGALIHFKVEIPWLSSWIGNLPGDLLIKKGNIVIYLPISTSCLFSMVFSLLFSIKK